MSGDTFDFVQGGVVTSSAQLNDPGATVGDVLTVQADKSIAAEPDGGSQPAGSFATKEFLFTEEATAGTYSADFALDRYSTVWDVLLLNVAVWDATSDPTLNVSDTQGGAGSYWTDYPLTNMGTVWNPAGVGAGARPAPAGNFNSVSDEGAAGGEAYRIATRYGSNAWPPGVTYRDADDTITIRIVTTIAPATPTGILLVRIRYTTPITPTNGTFS